MFAATTAAASAITTMNARIRLSVTAGSSCRRSRSGRAGGASATVAAAA